MCFFFLLTPIVYASQVNPNTDFDSPIDTDLWTVKNSTIDEPIHNQNKDVTLSLESGAFKYYGNGSSGGALQSDFYYIGDFDATVDVYTPETVTTYLYFNLCFFNYGVTIVPKSPDQGGNYGVDWGLAGTVYGWFLSSPNWLYSSYITDHNSRSVYSQEWYQLRVQRVGDDIFTYYKFLNDDEWILQHTYEDFGAQAVYVEVHLGTGTNVYSSLYVDNFVSYGYADTDPLSVPAAIPEPITIISLVASIVALKIQKYNQKIID